MHEVASAVPRNFTSQGTACSPCRLKVGGDGVLALICIAATAASAAEGDTFDPPKRLIGLGVLPLVPMLGNEYRSASASASASAASAAAVAAAEWACRCAA